MAGAADRLGISPIGRAGAQALGGWAGGWVGCGSHTLLSGGRLGGRPAGGRASWRAGVWAGRMGKLRISHAAVIWADG